MMHSVAPAFWAEAFNKHIGYNCYLLACVYGFACRYTCQIDRFRWVYRRSIPHVWRFAALLTHTHTHTYIYIYIERIYNIKNLELCKLWCWQGHFLFATDSAEMILSIFFETWFNLCWAPVELVLQRLAIDSWSSMSKVGSPRGALAAGLLVFCWTR